jgi:lipopolysaccharide/colanic/teichoic acid biosynthesis glycosyltransferase
VNRRTKLGEAEREQYDVFYAKNHTPALDFEIIFRSLRG